MVRYLFVCECSSTHRICHATAGKISFFCGSSSNYPLDMPRYGPQLRCSYLKLCEITQYVLLLHPADTDFIFWSPSWVQRNHVAAIRICVFTSDVAVILYFSIKVRFINSLQPFLIAILILTISNCFRLFLSYPPVIEY